MCKAHLDVARKLIAERIDAAFRAPWLTCVVLASGSELNVFFQSLMCLLEQVKPWTQMEMEASHRGMVPSRTRARVLSR